MDILPPESQWRPESAWLAHDKGIVALAWSHDLPALASGGNEGTVKFWDVRGGQGASFSHNGGAVRSVSWSPARRHVVAGWEDGSVRILDSITGEVLRTHEEHQAWIADIGYSPDGAFYASVSGDRSLNVRHAETGRTVRTFWSEYGGFMALAWSPDGASLASGNRGGLVSVWETGTWHLKGRVDFGDAVWSLDWHPASDMLAIAGAGGRVLLWRCRSGDATCLVPHLDTVSRAAFALQGHFLATLSHDETVEVRALRDLARQHQIPSTYPGASRSLAASHRHDLVAGTSRDGRCIEVRRITAGKDVSDTGRLVLAGSSRIAMSLALASAELRRRPVTRLRYLRRPAGGEFATTLEGRSSEKAYRLAMDRLVRDGGCVAAGTVAVSGQDKAFARLAAKLCARQEAGTPAKAELGPDLAGERPELDLAPEEWQAAFKSWLWCARHGLVRFLIEGETHFIDPLQAEDAPDAIAEALEEATGHVWTMSLRELSSTLTTLLVSRAAEAFQLWRDAAAIHLQEGSSLLLRWDGQPRPSVQLGLFRAVATRYDQAEACLRAFVTALLPPSCGQVPISNRARPHLPVPTPTSLGERPPLSELLDEFGEAAAAALWEEADDLCARQVRRDTLAARFAGGITDALFLCDPEDADLASAFTAGAADHGLCVQSFLLDEWGDLDSLAELVGTSSSVVLLLHDHGRPPPGFRAAFDALTQPRDPSQPRLRWLPIALPSFDHSAHRWIPDFLFSFDWHLWTPNPARPDGGVPGSLVAAALGDRSRA